MAMAVLGPHDALNNRMHLDAYAFAPSPTRPRRRRSPKPVGASSPTHKAARVVSPAPKAAAPRGSTVASPYVKTAAPGRRSPPPKTAVCNQQPSPTKEKRIVMEEVRILKRGEELPSPAPVAQAAAANNKHVLGSTTRIGPEEPTVMPAKVVAAANVAVYAGPGYASAPDASSLPITAFCQRRAEVEATRCLRCLLGIGQVA